MNRLMRWLLTLALLWGAASSAALAEPVAGFGAGAWALNGHRMMELLEGVGASEAQRRQIRDIYTAARAELSTLQAQALSLRQRQLALWSSTNIDAAAMEAVRKQLLAVQEHISARMQRALVDAGRVLNPEQRAKMVQRLAQRIQQMKEYRDRG